VEVCCTSCDRRCPVYSATLRVVEANHHPLEELFSQRLSSLFAAQERRWPPWQWPGPITCQSSSDGSYAGRSVGYPDVRHILIKHASTRRHGASLPGARPAAAHTAADAAGIDWIIVVFLWSRQRNLLHAKAHWEGRWWKISVTKSENFSSQFLTAWDAIVEISCVTVNSAMHDPI